MGADAPPVYPRQTESLIYVLYNTRQNPPKPLNEEFESDRKSHLIYNPCHAAHLTFFYTLLRPPFSGNAHEGFKYV